MNKFLLIVLVLVGINTPAFSQDVIVTKDSKKIEAKVIEINVDNIKYKNFSNPEGPTYTLSKSGVASIIYQNGTVDVFSEKTAEPVDDISKMESEFYAIGTDDNKMLDYLKKYDVPIYEEFDAACRQRSKGKRMLNTGVGFTAAGIVLYAFGVANYVNTNYAATYHSNDGSKHNDTYAALMVGGVALMVGGEILTVASIPVSISAGVKKKAIKEDFEQKYFSSKKYSYQPKLNFGFTQGGIGLTLNF
ncbi:MAG: hypothetical protein LBH19_00825 [Dysgonamonadaceae bacterium]|nr:hypothetical protein [Dysgonamonadaceae bacterium]